MADADAPRSGSALLRIAAHSGGSPLEDFLAGDTPVTIVPKFSSDNAIPLLAPSMAPTSSSALSLGPFDAVTPTQVPLWVAIEMRKANLCAIRPPQWLEKSFLKQLLDSERTSGAGLGAGLPADFAAVAKSLLDHAAEDIDDGSTLLELLEQLATVRRNKLADGLRQVLVAGGDVPAVRLENIAIMELDGVRALMAGAMEQHDVIRRAARGQPVHLPKSQQQTHRSNSSQTQTQFSQSQSQF